MKQRFFILFMLVIGTTACNNNSNNGAGLINNPHSANGMDTVAAARKPTMDFVDTTHVHDFGVIKQEDVVSYDFAFVNHGKTPLIINGAVGSCGCTVPEYPKTPIQPGEGGKLKVTFNSAGKSGLQNKTVTITANTLKGTEMLFIKSQVIVPEKSDKPATK